MLYILDSFFFYLFIFYLFIFGCFRSLLLCVGFLQLWRAGATLRCSVWASRGRGFSCCGAQALGVWASVVVARGLSSCGSWALERRLSSCGTRAQLLCSMWDLPGPGIEPFVPCVGRWILNHCATREVPILDSFVGIFLFFLNQVHSIYYENLNLSLQSIMCPQHS